MRLLAGVFVLGVAFSFCATRCVQEIQTHHALTAVLWDVQALLIAAMPWAWWAKRDHDSRILMADALGTAAGTLLCVKYFG